MEVIEVVPGDSVSQASQGPNPFNFSFDGLEVGKLVLTPEQYVGFYRDAGADEARALLEFCKSQQNLVNRCISMQAGSIRSASGSEASRCSSGVASGGSGLSGSRIFAARGLGAKKRFASRVPDGLCYVKMFKEKAVESASAKLGEWPTVASVMRTPFSQFQSLDDLEKFRLTGDPQMAHVAPGGSTGFPLLPALARLAAGFKYPCGSLGAVLAADGRGFKSASPMKLHSRTMLGGDVSSLRASSGSSGVPVHPAATPGARTWVAVEHTHLVRLPSRVWRNGESCMDLVSRLTTYQGLRCVNAYRGNGGCAYALVVCTESVARSFATARSGEYVSLYSTIGDLVARTPVGFDAVDEDEYDFYSFSVSPQSDGTGLSQFVKPLTSFIGIAMHVECVVSGSSAVRGFLRRGEGRRE